MDDSPIGLVSDVAQLNMIGYSMTKFREMKGTTAAILDGRIISLSQLSCFSSVEGYTDVT